MARQAAAATDASYDLAEGVIWDAAAERVRFVDIWAGRVLAGRLTRGRIDIVDEIVLGQTAGAVAVASDGGLLVAAARGLAVIDPDGAVSFGPDLLGDRGNVRLNDASVDPQGRFVVGTLSLTDDLGAEVLLRVSPDGTVETLRSGVHLSNGVAFSPDGSAIYHVDTFAGTVSRASYPDCGDWEVVLSDLPHPPDGLTVSADGDLWVAQFGGSGVLRFSPSGEQKDEITIDATQATCAAFVGPGLDILAITSAQENLDDWDDQSGAIFLADPGATGLPAHLWAGSTTHPYWSSS